MNSLKWLKLLNMITSSYVETSSVSLKSGFVELSCKFLSLKKHTWKLRKLENNKMIKLCQPLRTLKRVSW